MDQKSGTCPACTVKVTTLGSYAKSEGKLWHIGCHNEIIREEAFASGRAAVLREQEAARQEAALKEEASLRLAFHALPRCGKCGIRMVVGSFPASWGDVRLPNGNGRCTSCVREEVALRSVAKQVTPPPSAAPRAPDALKAETAKPVDRFGLIELE